jgi:anti-sigma B factor antagonist
MTLNIEEQNGGAVIHLGGRVMYDSDAHLFRRELEKLLSSGKRLIVVEMSKVVAISSTGLGILIAAYRAVKDKGGSCRLAELSEKVRSILEITRLNSVFDVYDRLDEALVDAEKK